MAKELNLSVGVMKAAKEYIKRKDRMAHPDGKFDSGGRWYASESEKQTCCQGLRTPSRAYPYSQMVHCRSLAHVAHLFNVDSKDLRRAIPVAQTEIDIDRMLASGQYTLPVQSDVAGA